MGNYMTVKEYAAFLGISEQAVYKQIRAGKLSAVELEKDGKKRILIEQPEPEAAAAAPEPDQGQPAALIAAIDALTEQLKAKDLQIAKLQQLLENAQLQQAHTSKLLEGKVIAAAVPEPAAVPDREASAPDQSAASSPAEPKAEKKRGFWSVFFD